ncbi:unnamed protein product [Adineta steineri]|uniref:choline-phosphate cytidylyltransferase n=2 Tax=Adineta steineri TaxID=433720 RepID=A0A818H8Y0_9BILA|nr:unnamed protein product [Adineta steineri]
MVDRTIATTSDLTNVDEWYDASIEGFASVSDKNNCEQLSSLPRELKVKANNETDKKSSMQSSVKTNMNISQNIDPAPLCYEEKAIQEREKCDYSIRITLDMAKNGTAPRKIRILADGVYDLFHPGHARQLMQAKNAFKNVYLLAGICNDKITNSKRGQTVMDDTERYDGVRHCRYVDEVVTDTPWVLDDEFLTQNKIDFVAHDDIPYESEDSTDVYQHLKSRGIFIPTQRTDGISTSDIICRLVRDYDMYVRRNLARGYSAEDLSVGFIKKNQLQLQAKLDTVKSKFHTYEEESRIYMEHWEERSKEYIHKFICLFERANVLNLLYRTHSSTMISNIPNEENNTDDIISSNNNWNKLKSKRQ